MPRLNADGALHGLEVPEPPELEVLLQVDQLLAGLVRLPVLVRVLVDRREDRHQVGVEPVRQGHVPLQDLGRHVVAVPGQVAQELVVDAGRLERLDAAAPARPARRRRSTASGASLLPSSELDRPVLVRLEARGGAEEAAELGVLAGGQGGQHRPLLGQAALDVLDPGQALERRPQLVGGELPLHRAQLVQDQLEPQLGGLVLQDEQQLVVVLGHADRVLRGEDLVQMQIAPVREVDLEVADDAVLERPFVAGRH